MGGTSKFPRDLAAEVAFELLEALEPNCERIEIAGSYRRGKSEVGDLELVYVPRMLPGRPIGLFSEKGEPRSAVDVVTDHLIERGLLRYRLTSRGARTWGSANRLAFHARTALPIDFFACTEPAWWNYLACRTGGQESNTRIATVARQQGYTWRMNGSGFQSLANPRQWLRVTEERHVWEHLGLEYQTPEERS